MKNTKNKLILGVAVLTLGATLAFAIPHEGDHGHHGRGRHDGFRKMSKALNLTDAQTQQIQDIRKMTHEQNAAIFESAHQTRKDFRAAKKADDTAALEALKPAMESQRAQMKQIRDAEMQKIALVLTAEQNARWQELKAEREQRWQKNK